MDEDSESKSQIPQKFVLVDNGFSNSGNEQTSKEEEGLPADYEEAITACGYGKFHYVFLISLIPVCSAQLFSSGTMSYVIPIAECDLQLTDFHKGMLNSGVYAGMILAAFFWGFASDIFGRRKLLILGFFLDAFFNFLTSVAHSFWLLLLLKILGGTSITGPNAMFYSYMAEVHDNSHRPRVIMITGGLVALAQAIQPGIAYFVIPMQFRYELIPGVLDFTSWRLFLMICSVPSFLSAVVFYFVPESPKFLMSKGRVTEALDSFKRIYATNTGRPPHTYPIKDLQVPPKQAPSSSAITSSPSSGGISSLLLAGWIQIRPIFLPPYLNIALLVFTIQIFIMICINSLRLWIPQLFATLDQATALILSNNSSAISETQTICDLLGSVESRTASQLEAGHICPPINGEVYLRSLIIGVAATISFLVSSTVVGCIDKRTITKICFPLAAVLATSMNWATSSNIFMILAALYTALMGNSLTSMNSLTVDLFPTAFRSMALSLTMMCGRMASLVGNIIFPILLGFSCSAVFFSIGAALTVNALLVWFIPSRIESR